MSIQPRSSIDRANIYENMKNYALPPLTAGLSIIPIFHLFIYKSAMQTMEPKPKMPPVKWIQRGVQAAPTIGFIVGSQIIFQRGVEKILSNAEQFFFNKQERQTESFSKMFLSSMIIGALSAPGWAAFNSQTAKKTSVKLVTQSVKELFFSKKQWIAIMTREAGFLFSIRVSGPVGDAVRERLGDNPVAIYTAVFLSGVIGALCSHPADTYFTALQTNFQVKTLKDCMRGSYYRALGVGCYAVLYKTIKENLEEKIEYLID